jgi:hypothetical protein
VSIFNKNKEILIKHYGGLFEEITSDGGDILPPEDIKIETTPCGEPSLCVKGIYVHSRRDPLREGQRLVQAAGIGGGPVVILGFGLGYAAQAATAQAAAAQAATGFRRTVSRRPVIIVEKYKNLLLKALELRDFSNFLSENRIIFVIGGTGEGITNALAIADELAAQSEAEKAAEGAVEDTTEGAVEDKAPSVIRNRALTGLDEEWYNAVEERIRTYKIKDEVNMATLKRFGRRWVRNLSRNMNAICDYPGISRLACLAAAGTNGIAGDGVVTDGARQRALPVFLAAAGPSLDKILPLLRDIHSRCIIVAVDTSLRFFVKNGIEPDFVLVVDPQFWNSRHLDRCVSGHAKTALIAESAVYPPVLNLPFKNIFLCGSLFPLGTYIEKQVDPKGRLGAGGSVATTAWDFARVLGGNEIWIAGLDLAFPDLKTHFRGARFEERSNSESSRFSPVEKWVVRALRDGIPFKARSASGGQVLTDRRLSLYAAWFENQFSRHPETRNLALFQNGLAIAGLHSAKAEDLLALPPRREEIDRRIEEAFSKIENEFRNPHEADERAQRYEKAVSGLKRGLENIKAAAESGASIARQALMRSVSPEQQKKILKDLDAVTRRITESEVKEVAGFLFPPAEDEKKNVSADSRASPDSRDPFRVYLKSSLEFFSSLAEAADNAWK